ncbi:nuclear factor 7, ovary-like [Protopterus annectens]|uniref:nuclear factor 7, ovary-like n=1 Tax=Protopterus annectens TaxID=7888 RepID=UPI001CFBD9B5|nr:nuclear factor 7, ovary-like [Protopterus annectens]
MAKLAPTVDDLIEDLQCPVCLEVLQDPVSQGCGHNLCKLCMEKVCAGNAYVSCPVCRKTFPAKDYAVNKLLTMLLENVQKSLLDKSENPLPSNMCPEHIEPLKLFCKTDGNLGCVVCMVSSVHEDHIFIPVQEAVTTYRKDLNITLSALTLLSKNLSELQNQQDEKISSIQEISNRLEQHIKTQFAKLYESLQMMEQQCIQDLKQEAFQALKKMKENLCGITEKKNRSATDGRP